MTDPQADDFEHIQYGLDLNYPSPEEDLIGLSKAVAYSPESQPYIEVRFLVLEVDDLILQLRWHIGQALLLLKRYPQITEEEADEGVEAHLDVLPVKEIPTRSRLLLRGYIARPERVLFTDLTENWKGGTVAGWIYHMMIDDAIARSLAILDRLARITSLVANVLFTNDKVYFRSKKLAIIHKALNTPETQRLVEIAQSEVFDLLLNYRDGWNHERLVYSAIAGHPPVDTSFDFSGQYIRISSDQLTGELLFALVRAAYDQVLQTLHEVRLICEQKVPNDRNNVFPQYTSTSEQEE